MEIHVSERRYKCGECGKLYKTIGHVREHMRAHSDERPYHCPRCNKGYKTKVMMLWAEEAQVFSLRAANAPLFHPPECTAGPSEDARGRETIRVSVLYERIQREGFSGAPRPPSHGGEAFQVSEMQPSLRRARDAKPTHAG